MAIPLQANLGPSDAFLGKVRDAIKATEARWLKPFGISLTHMLSSSFVEAMGNLSEVSLAAEIEGEPDYFDMLAAEEAIATELGLEVRIIPKRAIWVGTKPQFEASLVALK
jgi:hypothetical protein